MVSLQVEKKRHECISQSPTILIPAVFLNVLQSTLCYHAMFSMTHIEK